MSYEKLRADLCRAYPGWTFDVVDGMSLEQIASACSSGERPRGIPVASAGDIARITRDWRKYAGI